MNEMQRNDEEMVIDLADIWKTLKKNKQFIAKVTGACVALGVIGTLAINPGYEATAMLKVQPPRSLNKSMLDVEMINERLAAQYLATYGQILTSRSVIYEVIKGLKDPKDEGKTLDTLYDGYVSRIKTAPVKNATLMKVTISGKDEENTKKFSQLLFNTFFTKVANMEQGDSKNTGSYVANQLASAKANMEKAEKNLRDFQTEQKMLSPDEDVKTATAKLSIANNLKAQAEIGLKTAQAQLESIAAKLDENVPVIADNGVISNYRSKIAELTAKKISLEEKYTAKHPDLIQLNEEMAGLQEKLEQEITRVANQQAPSNNGTYQGLLAKRIASEVELEVNKSRLEAARQIEAEYAKDVETLSANQQKYVSLSREVTVTRDIFAMLTKRLEEAKVAATAENGAIQIVDAPIVEKAKRKGAMKVGISFMLGLLGSCGYVIGKELLNPKIKKPSDITDKTGIKVLVEIPEDEELAINAYRNLRSMLMAMPNVKTILFTSCISGEGKTTMRDKLAELMAKAGLKVALVNTNGLVGLVKGEPLQLTNNENLHVAQKDDMDADGGEILASKAMDALLNSLKENYDYVLVDAPALDIASDAIILSNKVDGVLQVVKAGAVHPNVFVNSLSSLQQAGAKVLGAVLKLTD